MLFDKIICQGVSGAYSHKFAIEKIDGASASNIEFVSTFDEVAKIISCSDSMIGVLPLENSTAGSVDDTYRLLDVYSLNICKLDFIKVEHCLLGLKGAKLSDIKEVSSHPQALMQCESYLQYNNIATKNAVNTAIASEQLACSKDFSKGVIASSLCANLYGLDILDSSVQDAENNYTRFIVITKSLKFYQENDRISLVCSTAHKRNSLSELINSFTECEINMTKIESKNIANTDFEVNFYIDIEGSLKDMQVVKLFALLSLQCRTFKILGSYKG